MTAPERHEPLTSALRLVVAFAGLIIYFADPSEHPARRPLALMVLLAFFVWGVAVYLLVLRRVRVPRAALPWVDLGWITLLVGVSQGTSGIFYPLYLFVILGAAFGQGFRAGMAITVASVVGFATVGALTAPRGSPVAIHFFVVRPLYLLVLGYLTSVWGGHEVRSRARLALLREVTTLSNPRFGIGRTLGRFLEAVRAHFDADSCRLVVAEEKGGSVWMRTAERGVPIPAERSPLPDGLREVLLPADGAGVFLVHLLRSWGRAPVTDIDVVGPGGAGPSPGARTAAAALATALEAGSLLSVPFRYHANAPGRLHVVRRRPKPFDHGEAEFLRQALDQVVPVLENIRLVDRLASDAASEERLRIARDLHDSVIQPYLGLRLGLSAARSAFDAGRVDEAGAHLARLADLADGEIETLRTYVRDLRAGEAGAGRGLLEAGLRRFCSRFSEATGIQVKVETEGPPVRNDRLAAEVFQMVAEGLSNVRRHTHASRADVRIRSSADRLELTIANDAAETGAENFFPRSLGERAVALGGGVEIRSPEPGTTTVRIDIPL